MKSLAQLAHFYFWQTFREAAEAAVMVKSPLSPIRSPLQARGAATPGWSGGRELEVTTDGACLQYTELCF